MSKLIGETFLITSIEECVPGDGISALILQDGVVQAQCRISGVPNSNREARLEEAIRKAKKLTDPDLEPYDQDPRTQLLAMRDRTTEAWAILTEALYE